MEEEDYEAYEEAAANHLAFLGLQRVGSETEDSPLKDGVQLNSRGIPARKRKKNSLIYGSDEMVSIPTKSPKKKFDRPPLKMTYKEPERLKMRETLPIVKTTKIDEFEEDDEEDDYLDQDPGPVETIHDSSFEDILEPVPVRVSSVKNITPRKVQIEQQHFEEEISVGNRLHAQRLGVALRNLLKLPKAHKWVCFEFFYSNLDKVLFGGENDFMVCFEFFYSNLDKVLFGGENDFMVCLKESFPHLKTRRLTRVEWCKVRRLMGKPRRCSEAFFSEERSELERKRRKIRMLQQRKIVDVNSFKDLPEEIPMQLTIGSRVTARLRKPADGLFSGVVDAVDTSNGTYRITFTRQGLGTHSVPDTEVLSTEPPDLMPLSSFLSKGRPRPLPSINSYLSPPGAFSEAGLSPQLTGDPLLSGSTPKGKSLRLDGSLGGYPVKFLFHIVRLNKSLLVKKEKVVSLRELNCQAEKMKSFGEYITEDFQRKYASTVLEVYKVNEELNGQLKEVASYTSQFGSEPGPSLSLPEQIKENCSEDSYDMVNKYNSEDQSECVTSPKLLALITALSSLMLQIKRLADGERNAAELEALKESVADIKSTLEGDSVKVFQDCVEVHMQHIQQGLSMMGNLTKFMETPGVVN